MFLKVIPSLWSWVCLPCKWNIHCTCIHQIFVHKVDTQVGGTMVKMYFINAQNFNCRDRKSNKEMPERTGIADLNVEIKKRRWKYLDHLLRRDTEIFEMDSTRLKEAWKTKRHMEEDLRNRDEESKIWLHGITLPEL